MDKSGSSKLPKKIAVKNRKLTAEETASILSKRQMAQDVQSRLKQSVPFSDSSMAESSSLFSNPDSSMAAVASSSDKKRRQAVDEIKRALPVEDDASKATDKFNGFRFDLLKSIARDNGISTRKQTASSLYQELSSKGLIPVVNQLQKECDDKPLSRLKQQAKGLGISTEGYTQDTKQLLCDEIDRKLRQLGRDNEFAGVIELGDKKCQISYMEGGEEVIEILDTQDKLVEKARKYGIPVDKNLDKSTLCFLIQKEINLIQSGQAKRPEYVPRKSSKRMVSTTTYQQFWIPPEIEDALNVSEQARAITDMKLRSSQIVGAEWLSAPENFGLTLFHEVGTGKTFSAINTSQILLRRGIIQHVIVITPKSLVCNFKDQFVRFNKDLATDTRYQFFTPDAFQKLLEKKNSSFQCLPDTMLIIDEAHNYRTNIWSEKKKKRPSIIIEDEDEDEEQKELSDQVEEIIMNKGKPEMELRQERADKPNCYDINVNYSGKKVRSIYQLLYRCHQNVKKVLLLTATPFVNSVYDLENLSCFMTRSIPRPLTDVTKMDDYPLRCLFHFHQTSEAYKKEYPRVNYHSEYFEMTYDYYMDYYKIQKDEISKVSGDLYKGGNLSRFYNGVRRASNVGPDLKHSDKLKAVITMVTEDVKKNPTIRILIYSSWLGTGIKVLEDEFRRLRITAATITGGLKIYERKQMVDRFNNIGSGLNVLLISKAGGEGLDLKRTRKVYILEPTWNDASIQQIIGRAVRYRSHADLPEKDREVDIYRLFLLKPFEALLLRSNNLNVDRMLNDYTVLGKYPKEFFKEVVSNTNITYSDSQGQVKTDEDLVMSIDLYLYKFLRKKQTQLDTYIDELERRSEECFDELEYEIDRKLVKFDREHPLPLGKHINRQELIIEGDISSRVKVTVPSNAPVLEAQFSVESTEQEEFIMKERERNIIFEIASILKVPDNSYECLPVERLDYIPNYDKDVKHIPVIKIGEGEGELSLDSIQQIVSANHELRELAEDNIKVKLLVMYRIPVDSNDTDGYILFNIYYKDPTDSRKLKRYGRIYKK